MRPARQYSDLRKSVFAGNVLSNAYGPLDTGKYPCIIPYHNNGILYGTHPNPAKFGYADNSSNVSTARNQYFQTYSKESDGSFKATKYNYAVPSSMRTTQKKALAIGKSGYKVGLGQDAGLSYKSYFPTDAYTHTRYVRSGGCVAPKKKSSIYNTSLRNGEVCCWGAIVRQNW